MRKLFPFFFISMLVAFSSCGSEESGDSQPEGTEAVSSDGAAETDVANSPADASLTAVCLWNQSGLRTAPGRGSDAKWVTAVSFGEVVTLTGEEVSPEGEDRTYAEMVLKGGDKGWSNVYLFAVDAERAASYGEIDIYKRPELTTFDGDQFLPGEIFAVMNSSDQEGWLEVYGLEKKKKGWIQENSRYTTDEVDVSVAIMFTQAKAEKSPQKQEEALNKILSNSTFRSSSLIGLIETELDAVAARAELPANQLYITATTLNMRTEASTESEVITQVSEGQIGTIIERGPEMVEVNGNSDYWYLIDVDGQEGWVFGHHTSKSQAE